jgi:hypothetical protein
MPRARRAWSDIRPAIRRLLRETDETNPYWSNALLLDIFNDEMDKHTMNLALSTEGWVTDEYVTSIVANQREYTLPEGAGRVKRVSVVRSVGGADYEVVLNRNERWSGQIYHSTSTTFAVGDPPPTFRLVGELVYIEATPREAITNGLRIDIESTVARLTGDASKLSTKFPSVLETLLKYETALGALRVEAAQGGKVDDDVKSGLEDMRDEFLPPWYAYIEERTTARVFTQPMYFGD